jgi:hypothetical protein
LCIDLDRPSLLHDADAHRGSRQASELIFEPLYAFTVGYTLQLLIAIMQNYEQARTEAVSTMPAVAKAY